MSRNVALLITEHNLVLKPPFLVGSSSSEQKGGSTMRGKILPCPDMDPETKY